MELRLTHPARARRPPAALTNARRMSAGGNRNGGHQELAFPRRNLLQARERTGKVQVGRVGYPRIGLGAHETTPAAAGVDDAVLEVLVGLVAEGQACPPGGT